MRAIWGAQSEAVVGSLRQHRQAAARRLIAQWEEAEHRLVAVANSLATLQNGQVRLGRWSLLHVDGSCGSMLSAATSR